MKSHSSVSRALVPGSTGGAHRRRTGTVRSRRARAIVAIALAVGGAGGSAAALAGGGGAAAAAHASIHHAAHSHAIARQSGVAGAATNPAPISNRPWIY
jgi:hypothetical protein